MSERQWTLPQKKAITARGGDLLISAAAGSGKTAVLTERVLSLITDRENPVDIDRLLIVTFPMRRPRKCGRGLPSGCTKRWSRSRKTPPCAGRAFCWEMPRSVPSMPSATGSFGRISRYWGCPAICSWAGRERMTFCRPPYWRNCWTRNTKRPSRNSCGSSSCFPGAGTTAR